jgi:hypothetical protein
MLGKPPSPTGSTFGNPHVQIGVHCAQAAQSDPYRPGHRPTQNCTSALHREQKTKARFPFFFSNSLKQLEPQQPIPVSALSARRDRQFPRLSAHRSTNRACCMRTATAPTATACAHVRLCGCPRATQACTTRAQPLCGTRTSGIEVARGHTTHRKRRYSSCARTY